VCVGVVASPLGTLSLIAIALALSLKSFLNRVEPMKKPLKFLSCVPSAI
jgi:hypothetical protein